MKQRALLSNEITIDQLVYEFVFNGAFLNRGSLRKQDFPIRPATMEYEFCFRQPMKKSDCDLEFLSAINWKLHHWPKNVVNIGKRDVRRFGLI